MTACNRFTSASWFVTAAVSARDAFPAVASAATGAFVRKYVSSNFLLTVLVDSPPAIGTTNGVSSSALNSAPSSGSPWSSRTCRSPAALISWRPFQSWVARYTNPAPASRLTTISRMPNSLMGVRVPAWPVVRVPGGISGYGAGAIRAPRCVMRL